MTVRVAAAGSALLAGEQVFAQEPSGDGSASPTMVTMLTYLLGSAAVLIVLVTAIFIYLLVRRAREQRAREALVEARFESEVLASICPEGVDAGGPNSSLIEPEGVGAPVLDIVRPSAGYGKQTEGLQDSARVLQEIVGQLRQANLLEGYETYLELHGQPKGMAAVTLRGGKKALVLSRLESEGFTTHQLRRYDYIICATEAGRPVLLQSLAEYIASRFTM